MDFTTIIYNLLLTLVTTGVPILIGGLTILIKQHFSAKQLKIAQVIASNSVSFSEQISKELNLNNEGKLNSALASAQELATKFGVKLNSDQWKSLIEPCVNELKKGLNDVVTPSIDVPVTIAQSIVSDSTQPILNEVAPIPDVPVTPIIPSVEVTPVIVPIIPEIAPVVAQTIQDTIKQQVTEQILAIAQKAAQDAVDEIVKSSVKSVVI